MTFDMNIFEILYFFANRTFIGFLIGVGTILGKSLVFSPIFYIFYKLGWLGEDPSAMEEVFHGNDSNDFAEIMQDQNRFVDICLKGPLREEFIHRGVIGGLVLPFFLRSMSTYYEIIRVILSSLIFGLAHLVNSRSGRKILNSFISLDNKKLFQRVSKVSLAIKIQAFLAFLSGFVHEWTVKEYGWLANLVVHITCNTIAVSGVYISKKIVKDRMEKRNREIEHLFQTKNTGVLSSLENDDFILKTSNVYNY